MAQTLHTYVMADTQKIGGKESTWASKKTRETEEGQDSIHQGPVYSITGVNPSARPIIGPGFGYMPNY